MSFTLGNITLPKPKEFTREFVESEAQNLTIDGISTRNVENRKEKFTLVFNYLTQDQINEILSEYQLQTSRTFTVDETYLSISATNVLIYINSREYIPSAKEFLENLTISLLEVV